MKSASRPPSLKRGFAWTLAGNLVYAGSQWAILSLISKHCSDEASGQFGIGMTLTAPLFMFAGLDLRLLLATDSRREYRFSEYLTLRIIGSVLATVAVIGVVLWRGDSTATLAIVLAVALGKAVEFVSDIFYGRWQIDERLDRVSRSTMLHGSVSCAGFAVVLMLTGSVLLSALASGIGRMIVLLTYDIRLARSATGITLAGSEEEVGCGVSGRRLLNLARSGSPLAIKTLLVSLNTQTARLFVERMAGMAAMGVFYPISHVGFAGLMFSRAMNQSVASRLGKYAQSGQTNELRTLLRKLLGLYAILGLTGVCVAIVAGPLLLRVFFNARVAAESHVLVLIMGAMVFQFLGGILELAMTALRKLSTPVWLSAGSLAILAVSCRWLIPEFGLGGAALAMIVSRIPRPFILAAIVFRTECRGVSEHSDEGSVNRQAA